MPCCLREISISTANADLPSQESSVYDIMICLKERMIFFLCRELIPGYLDGITGVYQTPNGYYVKDEDVEEFDKGFPPKEKLKLSGQIF